MEDFGWIK